MERSLSDSTTEAGEASGIASSYMPICLLNTLGKLYEALIKKRIEEAMDTVDTLAENQ